MGEKHLGYLIRDGIDPSRVSKLIVSDLGTRRLDMLHHALSLILNGALHVVELPEKVHRVLDCGTGKS